MRRVGLKWRITLTVVLSAVVACGLLAVSVLIAVGLERDRVMLHDASESASRAATAFRTAFAAHPSATQFSDVNVPDLGQEYLIAEAMTPMSQGAAVDPSLTQQFFFTTERPFADLHPGCIVPSYDGFPGVARSGDEGMMVDWGETCEGFVIGHAWFRAPEGAAIPAWLVTVVLDPAEYPDSRPQLAWLLAGNAALIVLGASVIGRSVATMVQRPLTRAREMAESVARGDLGVRIPAAGSDEVARMSAAVNTMADTLTDHIGVLERANRAQRRFVSDVAHELRTPTAALLASAEALENPATRDEAAPLVAPQLRRLSTLTEDLLEISRMDAGRATLIRSWVDVVDLIREVVAETGRPAEVTVVAPGALAAEVDAARLRVAVRNLIANALQHGRPPVLVTLSERHHVLELTVADVGDGVPEGLRERVFDRFARGDEARHAGGSGLGLAIARENVRLQGGEVTLAGDGRTFVLRLPDG